MIIVRQKDMQPMASTRLPTNFKAWLLTTCDASTSPLATRRVVDDLRSAAIANKLPRVASLHELRRQARLHSSVPSYGLCVGLWFEFTSWRDDQTMRRREAACIDPPVLADTDDYSIGSEIEF
jgi:hypothetical protein